MQFFTATMEQLSAYQELMRARQEGVTPVSFTGVSQIHKAHLLAALSQTSAPVLVITADEAEARRLCDDVNTMLEETAAWVFPAKEVILTPVEGITTAYEHARIGALAALQNGQCKVVAASIEAAPAHPFAGTAAGTYHIITAGRHGRPVGTDQKADGLRLCPRGQRFRSGTILRPRRYCGHLSGAAFGSGAAGILGRYH